MEIDPPALYADDVLSCPVAAAVQTFSGKWKPILLHMLCEQKMHFAQIARALPKASKKVLTAQLRELEADGLITRTPTDEPRVRVIYAMSESGKQLAPILLQLYSWEKMRRLDDLYQAA
ncbi:winged helix-turn-helix transcriptional regulator [Maritalea mediterranea]|uniref:Helix-turn-helix transcriptional regulator n=1 Tax=Maritalea mediterranea TaxID=2909667 RepID=A0ABS9E7Y7_9HYPH|nr:helix-turn-helix domain-containing protein [Maritalea mediterranea]MCF4098989.1 helix-turn-helix transcriptional regulator [Maritalea mediterranea]